MKGDLAPRFFYRVAQLRHIKDTFLAMGADGDEVNTG
jgi:hypothetical protein